MTTNWDTLLERAAEHDHFYTTVTKPSDLAWAPSPRIVKLHGTIGVTDTFVAAREDYRRYPESFAPFVNFARQAFIENELCLLGFSGEDPNFLQWAGWVRDNLADHARNIYLVGALNLSAPQRVYLESISIAPIDLWDAVKDIQDSDLRHKRATELFLQAMWDEGKSKPKPYDWHPTTLHRTYATPEDHTRLIKDHEYGSQQLKAQLDILRRDRESYPGWLVCPPSLRWWLQNQITQPFPTPGNIAALMPDDRVNLLYEIAWRYSITFEYISPWMADELFKVASQEAPCAISRRQQVEIALILLKNSRWLNSSPQANQVIEEYVPRLTALLEKYAQYLPDCSAELAYHRALLARDKLDYHSMEKLAEEVVGEDPAWKLRQAALLMELGRFDEGERLIRTAYRELKEHYRYNQNSIYVLSRLSWSHWLLKAATQAQTNKTVESLPQIPKEWLCDPWIWIEDIREKANNQRERHLKNQKPIEPLFGQGSYRDNSGQISYNNETAELLLLDGITRNVGIPLRSGSAFMNVDLLAGTAEMLVLSGGIGDELMDYILAVRVASSEDSPSIKAKFTRIGVACASSEVVDILVERTLNAIEYWRKQRSNGTKDQQGYSLSALRVLMEVLARLVVRTAPVKAKDIFKLSVSIGLQRDLQNHWLAESLDSLLTYSLDSIPRSEHGYVLPDALKFPLNVNIPRWPNPVINNPNCRDTYINLSSDLAALIEAVASINSRLRTSALIRLIPLVERSFLTSDECTKLADALWGKSPDYQKLPSTDLFPHAFLILPSTDEEKKLALIRRVLYQHDDDVLANTQKELRTYPSPEIQHAVSIYMGMAHAAANKTFRLLPTSEEALAIFDRLMLWRPRVDPSENNFFGSASSSRNQLIEAIGNALSYAIVPALADEAKTKNRFEKLKAFYEEIPDAFSVIPAFVYFCQIDDHISIAIEKFIRKSLQSSNQREVNYAALAIRKWVEIPEAIDSEQLQKVTLKLVHIIDSGRTTGLPNLLWIARKLFVAKGMTESQLEMLREASINAFEAADYSNIDPSSREAISASSIRKECVKLASAFVSRLSDVDNDIKELLEAAKTDALPEVRYALQSAAP